MVVNQLYYDEQELPDLDDIDYMIGDGIKLTCKVEDTTFTFDSKALERALENIYSSEFNSQDDIEINLFDEISRIINDATQEGVGNAKLSKEFSRKIKLGNDIFSAFKVHRMQGDMVQQMYDDDGLLKPFNQWKSDVHPLLNHQVKHWLQTEYDTAVIRARQAADWQRFEEHADILPNLEWMPSTSATPGADHMVFWGTVLPINHPFWAMHRPGDRWNCKCSLSATDEEPTKVPPVANDKDNEPSPGLDNNPGVDGRLFSDTHPYIAFAHQGAAEAVKTFISTRSE